jgi:hypothetical protein
VKISTNAAQGPVPDTTVLSVPVIGAFSKTSISFPSGRAGMRTGIQLLLQPEMLIQPEEMVIVKLSDFSGDSGALDIPRPFSTATWSRETETLTIVVASEIKPRSNVTLVIPSDFGLILPVTGFTAESLLV